MPVITGLDLSLTSAGVARITRGDALGHEVQVRSVKSKPPAKVTLATRSARLRRLAAEIVNHCRGSDLIVVESPTYSGKSTGSAWDRAGLWWLVVGRLTGAGLQVVEVELHALKTYATGVGNADKDRVVIDVTRRYPDVDVTSNDEADALTLAAMGARFSGFPIEPGALPKTHLRAMDKVSWLPTR